MLIVPGTQLKEGSVRVVTVIVSRLVPSPHLLAWRSLLTEPPTSYCVRRTIPADTGGQANTRNDTVGTASSAWQPLVDLHATTARMRCRTGQAQQHNRTTVEAVDMLWVVCTCGAIVGGVVTGGDWDRFRITEDGWTVARNNTARASCHILHLLCICASVLLCCICRGTLLGVHTEYSVASRSAPPCIFERNSPYPISNTQRMDPSAGMCPSCGGRDVWRRRK
jgi:hypothetical protein